MKIWHMGSLPANQLYSVTCRHCRTLFEFERREAEFFYDRRDGDFLRIKCPLCKFECVKAV